MAKSYCIVCGNERRGIPVREDYVIGAIRWFKRNVTKNEKNNRLVVCKESYPEYVKKRKRYESRQRLYLALGVAFVILSFAVSPRILTIFISLLVLVLLYLFSLLSYMPKIDIKKQRTQ